MNDHASASGEDSFTPEEQAAFDAYERGDDAPAAAPAEPAGGDAPVAGAAVAPEGAAPAGEPPAAPGEVVDPDDESADDAEANKGRFVRHGAFHKERERRKAVERQFAELQDRFARGDERMRLLTEALQRAPQQPAAAAQAPAEPETPPDPNADIFGYAKYLEGQIKALGEGQQKVTDAQKKADDDRRAADEERAVVGAYQQDISRVLQADPTFGDAYRFLVDGRVAELTLMGFTQDQAIERANADELALVRSAISRGQSPADLMSRLAKQRGFAPKAADPAPVTPPAETPVQKAERIAQGRAASKSLSAAGGAPAGEVTIDMLADMSEAEFANFAKASPAKLAALMGAA